MLIGFPAELLVAHTFGEPYPALFQPGFPGHPYQAGVLKVDEPFIVIQFADGTIARPAYQELLPKSELEPLTIFENQFYDERELKDPRTQTWLRQRVKILYPSRRLAKLTINWTQDRISVDDPSRATYKLVKSISVVPDR